MEFTTVEDLELQVYDMLLPDSSWSSVANQRVVEYLTITGVYSPPPIS